MYTDKITIRSITRNKNTGKFTVTNTNTNQKARVESEDLRKKDKNGNTIIFSKLIVLPPSVAIKKGDEIDITKIGGVPTTDEPTILVELVFKAARFSPHHIEVWCK